MKRSVEEGFPVAITLFLVVVLVTSICVLCPTPVIAKDKYGAIAYSHPEGVCSTSNDYDSKEGAERRALEVCRQSGGTKCQILTSHKNKCGAVAVGDGGIFGWAWSSTKKNARERAMSQCTKRGPGCKVLCEVCTGVEISKSTLTPTPGTTRVVPVPPRRTCRCCYRERFGRCRRNPRTGRITCVDGVRTKCSQMSISRCRSIRGRCVR